MCWTSSVVLGWKRWSVWKVKLPDQLVRGGGGLLGGEVAGEEGAGEDGAGGLEELSLVHVVDLDSSRLSCDPGGL